MGWVFLKQYFQLVIHVKIQNSSLKIFLKLQTTIKPNFIKPFIFLSIFHAWKPAFYKTQFFNASMLLNM